jgi:hypothetical protein
MPARSIPGRAMPACPGRPGTARHAPHAPDATARPVSSCPPLLARRGPVPGGRGCAGGRCETRGGRPPPGTCPPLGAACGWEDAGAQRPGVGGCRHAPARPGRHGTALRSWPSAPGRPLLAVRSWPAADLCPGEGMCRREVRNSGWASSARHMSSARRGVRWGDAGALRAGREDAGTPRHAPDATARPLSSWPSAPGPPLLARRGPVPGGGDAPAGGEKRGWAPSARHMSSARHGVRVGGCRRAAARPSAPAPARPPPGAVRE